MGRKKLHEQSIAVFGESGSGKTVLLSSFYGPTQDHSFSQENKFLVVADSSGQGNALHRNYLEMRDGGQVPQANHFTQHTYSFTIKVVEGDSPSSGVSDMLRLVWHDYPGEWFEQDVSGEAEAKSRLDAFRNLLRSDVALLLVDGQVLLEHAGEEERYLKSLFANLRNGIYRLREELLAESGPLVVFPRIWVIALSKADVLPAMDVDDFRNLMVRKATDEIESLREAIASLVKSPEALSVGEDFMRLSSARFTPGNIDVTERVGVDLILALAAMLPLERHTRWTRTIKLPRDVAENLLGDIGRLARVTVAALAKTPNMPSMMSKAVLKFGPDTAELLVTQVGSALIDLYDKALAKRHYATALLVRFKMQLEQGEESRILRRSQR